MWKVERERRPFGFGSEDPRHNNNKKREIFPGKKSFINSGQQRRFPLFSQAKGKPIMMGGGKKKQCYVLSRKLEELLDEGKEESRSCRVDRASCTEYPLPHSWKKGDAMKKKKTQPPAK